MVIYRTKLGYETFGLEHFIWAKSSLRWTDGIWNWQWLSHFHVVVQNLLKGRICAIWNLFFNNFYLLLPSPVNMKGENIWFRGRRAYLRLHLTLHFHHGLNKQKTNFTISCLQTFQNLDLISFFLKTKSSNSYLGKNKTKQNKTKTIYLFPFLKRTSHIISAGTKQLV